MANSNTLSAQIHDKILEMVIDAGEDSGELLLTERELVDRYGVSKAPVREALLRLCSEEVLKSIPRCGYVVIRLGEKNGRDNLAVRRILELSSLEQYFDHFTGERIDEIARRLNDARRQCEQDSSVWQVWQANIDFHCDLISVSNNPYLVKHLKNCIEVERRYYAQNHYDAARRFVLEYSPEAHENILEAIRRGDKPEALRRLDQDIGGGMAL